MPSFTARLAHQPWSLPPLATWQVNELERKLRQQVGRLKQLSQAPQGGGGGKGASAGGGAAGGKGAAGKAAGATDVSEGEAGASKLRAELAVKTKELEAKDAELSMLKDMVRARKADARTRELKAEVANKRRIRTDAPPTGGAHIEVSPASSGVTPARRSGPPLAGNMMRALPHDDE
jgi:hypothetical protein